MLNLNVFYRFLAIKLELFNIHEYANQLICIFNFIITDNAVALI